MDSESSSSEASSNTKTSNHLDNYTVTPTFTIESIPRPPFLLPSHISAYKHIRLLSLQLDPQAFGSTYARESSFGEDVWEGRVGASGRVTFYASCGSSSAKDEGGRGDEGDEGLKEAERKKGEERLEKREEWLGTASILHPSYILPSNLPILPSDLISKGVVPHEDVYLLVGMWVRPEWRRRGVGRDLVRRALRHVDQTEGEVEGEGKRNSYEEEKENKGKRKKVKVTFLDVHRTNKGARGMYESLGFQYANHNDDEGDDEGGHGTVQMYYIHS